MEDTVFKAMIVEEPHKGIFTRRIGERRIGDLPPGEVIIRVHFSSLNYKDALSATGHPGVSRNFPHTPGVDAAGEVAASSTDALSPGDRVIVTGYDLGMGTPGGFGQYIRVPAAWVLKLPPGLSLRESMILGTAGFTAALSVLRLMEAGVRPASGDVLVSGATGGVGSIAVGLLAKAGYRVVAASGKEHEREFLRSLGAAEVISRDELLQGSERPLMKERWAGAVDVVGGTVLAAILKGTRYGGTVTCCGLVGSSELPANVFPFILRGVGLLGIDSVQCPMGPRVTVWNRLADDWKLDTLAGMAVECGLNELEQKIQTMLHGGLRGRTVVNLSD
ncbi:YhdH/YhfP family quinone oxidoreductase [Oryzomonas sagensis]|uniref:YhdH/YhfP family quinone oxidoreductase n=1 Tax=Oryzomonas sagensis TaxID=2603857 RepID=A0ABQ6TT51_9BACT|nr:YhdH/YhfP family quinone oxidoreductase [Oryzomonas sagensis]KAB0672173.1 YhdH/YhfP family quinone oxidoreductase [Oryzomonas sagensis]